MNKWDAARISIIIILIWLIIFILLYFIAGNEAREMGTTSHTHGEVTWMLFQIYFVQVIKGACYFLTPILLFLILCALLKDR